MSQPIEIIAKGLTRERQRAGLSLTEVARRAGVAKSTLSQLEAGQGNPSIETLWALCVALNIPFARLMEEPSNQVQVIRCGDGPTVSSEIANYKAILLATCPPHARRDVYLLIVEPGEDRLSEPHPVGSVEHIIVVEGRALVGLIDEAVELGVGDYICYPADQKHIFRALETGTKALLISEQN
ncbi:transcriptional regulator [Acinetobacter baumannii]|uniref:helix-turn-helix domain-containing protein n=1 Tax=Acinetobacter baumannii TaxID=470 RepID=UPI000A355915|nr:XRE family transcriptional regulator [Acinetobacter baumannii]MCT9165799.1 XRE family transcriptional regulator [Acinetobacter baumannii]MCT9173230.1 XRE family transcriptional regulator [Acinetobacter baumannii]MCT9180566.1 XRE family transcriptional regulator [Acinetobacter baumannii]OTK46495.1 transcriptional regulator [Acinetobacter baumannii]